MEPAVRLGGSFDDLIIRGPFATRNEPPSSGTWHGCNIGVPTLQTTSMHIDVLRDLKRINGHLMSVAAPILEEANLLRDSRLKKG